MNPTPATLPRRPVVPQGKVNSVPVESALVMSMAEERTALPEVAVSV